MQIFLVRPVMIGLLSLILAGLWGMPLGKSGGGALGPQLACSDAVASLLHHMKRC